MTSNGPGRWRCHGCGATSKDWPEAWAWFGSYVDLEERGVEAVGITCGKPDCNAAAERHVNGATKSAKRATGRKRKAERLREQALAKLTPEEREALGVQV